jgi:hypothetical protein
MQMFSWPKISEHIPIPEHPSAPYHPTNRSREALTYWLQFSDHYMTPHVQLFASVHELFEMLKATDLAAVSLLMQSHNKKRILEAHSQWNFLENHIRIHRNSRLLSGVAKLSPDGFGCSYPLLVWRASGPVEDRNARNASRPLWPCTVLRISCTASLHWLQSIVCANSPTMVDHIA